MLNVQWSLSEITSQHKNGGASVEILYRVVLGEMAFSHKQSSFWFLRTKVPTEGFDTRWNFVRPAWNQWNHTRSWNQRSLSSVLNFVKFRIFWFLLYHVMHVQRGVSNRAELPTRFTNVEIYRFLKIWRFSQDFTRFLEIFQFQHCWRGCYCLYSPIVIIFAVWPQASVWTSCF